MATIFLSQTTTRYPTTRENHTVIIFLRVATTRMRLKVLQNIFLSHNPTTWVLPNLHQYLTTKLVTITTASMRTRTTSFHTPSSSSPKALSASQDICWCEIAFKTEMY